MPTDDQDIAWLLRNQASLDQRLERVENSLIFRTLRALGRQNWYRPIARTKSYPEWRKQHSVTLPHHPFDLTRFTSHFATGADFTAPALAHFAAAAAADPTADFFYSDEDTPTQPLFKPDWSPLLLRSVNYLGTAVAIRREHLAGHADVPSAIRALPNPRAIHIPDILHTSPSLATLVPAVTPLPALSRALVSIVVCTRTARLLETCLAGIRSRTGHQNLELIVVQHQGPDDRHIERIIAKQGARGILYNGDFNFAIMNNLAAETATGSILVFLNDDVDPLKPDWLGRLIAHLEDPAIGAAGAKLTFPDGVLQHAGIAARGISGAWHPGRRVPASLYWPWDAYTREVSAVTAACMAVRTADFRRLHGFDPAFPVNFNDVDLCFRLQEAGLSVIVDVEAELRHDESRTRAAGATYEERRLFYRKWSNRLELPDPYFTRHLVQNDEQLLLG